MPTSKDILLGNEGNSNYLEDTWPDDIIDPGVPSNCCKGASKHWEEGRAQIRRGQHQDAFHHSYHKRSSDSPTPPIAV